MITLYASGPLFGQPDPSPFVTKAIMLLKMAGIPFEAKPLSFSNAPKGKIPYDATVFALLFSAAATLFQSEIGEHIRSRPALMIYLERIRSSYFPECKL
jgi:hypothetical protein